MRIGVDLGGTKIEIIALNAQNHELYRQRVATPVGDYKKTITTIRDMVFKLEYELEQTGSVGLGVPGAISALTGRIKNANSVCLIGQDIIADLGSELQRPIRLSNDANCFTLSEASDGAAAGYESVFGVIIGTGTGGGICTHGKLLTGVNAIAGEWGHNSLPWLTEQDLPLPTCYCGKQGCIETYLSGPGMMAEYKKLTGKDLRPERIVLEARQGESFASVALDRYIERLAKSLASVINLLDPDVVVLGGGLANIDELYEEVPRRWHHYIFSDGIETTLVPAKYGDASGVRGAAWLW